jgi:hypothetical protein
MHWHRESKRSPSIVHQESRTCRALAVDGRNDLEVLRSTSRHLEGRISSQTLQAERVIASMLEVLGELQQLAGFRGAHLFDHML